jgi:hypothetical protein
VKTRHERLNALAELNQAQRYLEIGVCDADTFDRVTVAHKVGVDPHFRFDPASRRGPGVELHALPSDDYFAALPDSTPPFDLIFLDGLHTYAQTLRDLHATFALSHARTIWLIDDTCPDSALSADPDMTRSIAAKRALGVPDRGWMGDVFKVVAAVHDTMPELRLRTFANLGQTVLWRAPRDPFTPVWGSLDAIAALTYDDFVAHGHDVFARSRPEAIVAEVRETLSRTAE